MRRILSIILSTMLPILGTAGAAPAQEAGARRITLSFSTSTTALKAGPPVVVIELVESRPVSGQPQQQRDPQLSPHHLVVVAIDDEDRELWRTVIADPLFVRGETTDSSGELVSTEIVLQQAKSPVVVPDDPRMRGLRVFRPVWTGEEFVLNLVNTVDLPSEDAAGNAGEESP